MPSPPVSLLRQAAERRLARAEAAIEVAVVEAMRAWLDAARVLIIAEASTQLGLTAAGFAQPARAVDAATAAWNDWRRGIDNNVLPAISVAFGEGMQAVRRDNPGTGSFTPQQEYMATVADRLRIWPAGIFEDLRPELLEALAEAETIEQITDRVGMVLGIDKDQRAIKARINEIDAALDDPESGLDKTDRAELRAEKRKLWEAHDEEETRWRWKARRIARTEAHGAVNAGQLAAARQAEAETGDTYWKRWLATDDSRTRAEHRVADGQAVRLSQPFRVGGWMLQFPGDPVGPGHLSINCRCSMVVYHPDSLQDALQGPAGSLGEVKPEGVRIGPDDPDEVQAAVDKVVEDEHRAPPAFPDDRGEDHGQPIPSDPTPVDITDDRDTPVGPVPDLDAYSDDDLLDLMMQAMRDDDGLYEAAIAEYDRRQNVADDLGKSLIDAPPPTLQQVDAVARWQGTDRYYQRVQSYARGDLASDDVVDVYEQIAELIADSELLEETEGWRGNRDSVRAVGVPADALESLVGTVHRASGFVAVSLDKGVAESEFTRPPLGGGPFLMRLRMPAGTAAAWISGLGDKSLAYQQEMLMDGPLVRYLDVDRTNPDLPVVIAEVVI